MPTKVDQPALFKQFRAALRQQFGKQVKCQLKIYGGLITGRNSAFIEVSLDDQEAIKPIALQVYGDAFKEVHFGSDRWPVLVSIKGWI